MPLDPNDCPSSLSLSCKKCFNYPALLTVSSSLCFFCLGNKLDLRRCHVINETGPNVGNQCKIDKAYGKDYCQEHLYGKGRHGSIDTNNLGTGDESDDDDLISENTSDKNFICDDESSCSSESDDESSCSSESDHIDVPVRTSKRRRQTIIDDAEDQEDQEDQEPIRVYSEGDVEDQERKKHKFSVQEMNIDDLLQLMTVVTNELSKRNFPENFHSESKVHPVQASVSNDECQDDSNNNEESESNNSPASAVLVHSKGDTVMYNLTYFCVILDRHEDDFPTYYYTIRIAENGRERQTTGDRLTTIIEK